MKGPRPKPTHLKLLTGNPGHRPINVDEPEPDGDLKDPPASFSPRQRIIWQECIANAPPGMLKRLDAGALIAYVVAVSVHERAAKNVADGDLTVVTPNGQYMPNPFISIMNSQAQIMYKAIAELGFSPSSRSRVKVTGKKKAKSTFGKLRELKLD